VTVIDVGELFGEGGLAVALDRKKSNQVYKYVIDGGTVAT
jgi:hypothetical protein